MLPSFFQQIADFENKTFQEQFELKMTSSRLEFLLVLAPKNKTLVYHRFLQEDPDLLEAPPSNIDPDLQEDLLFRLLREKKKRGLLSLISTKRRSAHNTLIKKGLSMILHFPGLQEAMEASQDFSWTFIIDYLVSMIPHLGVLRDLTRKDYYLEIGRQAVITYLTFQLHEQMIVSNVHFIFNRYLLLTSTQSRWKNTLRTSTVVLDLTDPSGQIREKKITLIWPDAYTFSSEGSRTLKACLEQNETNGRE